MRGSFTFRGGWVLAARTTASGEEAGLVTIAGNGVADKQLGREVETVKKWGLEK